MNETLDGSFVVALEFGGTERCVASVLRLGVPGRLALPASITWPDGSQSDAIEVHIQAKPEKETSLIPD